MNYTFLYETFVRLHFPSDSLGKKESGVVGLETFAHVGAKDKLGSMADLFLLKPKSMEDETQIRRLCEESVGGCQQPLN